MCNKILDKKTVKTAQFNRAVTRDRSEEMVL